MRDTITLRRARHDDVPAIVALLADDFLGRTRESAGGGPEIGSEYLAAFEAIDGDPRQLLWVATEVDGTVVGTLQLTFIPGLSRGGAWRAHIEAVRIAATHRGSGLGAEMIESAITEARERGCAIVQLTTDLRRERAHQFYERLGFVHTHAGYKLAIA